MGEHASYAKCIPRPKSETRQTDMTGGRRGKRKAEQTLVPPSLAYFGEIAKVPLALLAGVLMVGLFYGARNFLSYTRHMM